MDVTPTETPKRRRLGKKKSGVTTGARVALLFAEGKARPYTVKQVADRLNMERGYIQKILQELYRSSILVRRKQPRVGTKDVWVYTLTARTRKK